MLATLALVTGSPLPAAAAAGLLAVAAVFEALPLLSRPKGSRTVDAVRVVEGGQATSVITAAAATRLPALVTLADRPPRIGEIVGQPEVARVAFLRFDAEATTRVSLPVPGMATFGPAELSALDPLGLTRRRVDLADQSTVRVWPAADALREHNLRARYERMFAGRHPVRSPGSSLNFYGIREYSPTDPMRAVNWKATVKAGGLMVNQFEHETYGEAVLFLDTRLVTGVGTRRDNALLGVLRAAASFAAGTRGQGDVVKAHAFGGASPRKFQMEPGRPWVEQFNDWLVELEPAGAQPVTAVFDVVLPRLTPKSIVLFISPMTGGDPLGDAPVRALALGNTVVVLATPVPTAGPPALVESLQRERAEGIEATRARGIEVLDLERTANLVEALAQRGMVR